MSLILHIVRKDFLRLRWRIALWAAVLMAKVAHGFALLAGDGSGQLVKSGMQTAVILSGLDVAVCVVLVAMLVQEDLLIGTRAAWMTRPVSAWRLLAAKVTGAVLLFGVFPVLVWLPWWLHCGYGAEQLAWAVGETLGWQLLIVAPAMMMAALTDSLGRFFLWSVVAVALGIMSAAWVGTGLAWLAFGSTLPVMGIALAYAVIVAGSLTATVAHYRWRRHVNSLGVGAAAVAVVVAAVWGGAVTLTARRVEDKRPWDENAERAAGATLALERARDGAVSSSLIKLGRGRLDVELRLEGIPADRMLSVVEAEQTWSWPGGPTASDKGWQFFTSGELRAALGIAPVPADAETERWRAEQGAEVRQRVSAAKYLARTPRTEAGRYFLTQATLPRSVIERLGREPAEYEAEVRFMLLRAEVRREEPLVPGVWGARAGAGLKLAQVARKERGLELRWVETRPMLPGEFLSTTSSQMQMMRRWQLPELTLIQRSEGYARRVGGNQMGAIARVGTVAVRWQKTEVAAPVVVRDGKWVVRDADWFTEARLALVGWTEEARFTRQVKVEKFLVDK